MGSKRRRRQKALQRAAKSAGPGWGAKLRALWYALLGRTPPARPHPTASTVDSQARPLPARTDFEPTRVVARSHDGEDSESDWLPPSRMARSIEVSEEPMHTLPAELQDEFNRPPSPPRPPPAPPKPDDE